ncbi:hypothetical protein H9P43_006230 [Blastocladiella emersonii ATCC 22665]|nr:hypothetical protein H9P43_006230 [Blastocladiella emersonii ATCC 22665]
MTRVHFFRNAKNTLTLVTRDAALGPQHMHQLPLNLRPPTFRRDHWTPFLVIDSLPSPKAANTLVARIAYHATPVGRDHRAVNPVEDKVVAAARALEDLVVRGDIKGEDSPRATWERMDLQGVAVANKVMWPGRVRHEPMSPKKEKPYLARVEAAWREKGAFGAAETVKRK